jgi:hypothetical protein
MEHLHNLRDEFLERKKDLLIHFLNDNDYFKKKEKREVKKVEKEGKKMEVVAAAETSSSLPSVDTIVSSSSSLLNDSAVLSSNIINTASSSNSASSVADALVVEGQSSNGEIAGIAMQSVEKIIPAPDSSLIIHSNEKLENGNNSSIVDSMDGKTNGFIKHTDEDGEIQNASESSAVEEEDSNVDPPELQVSYAMRNVPIIKQPKTLIADLHEHQACLIYTYSVYKMYINT